MYFAIDACNLDSVREAVSAHAAANSQAGQTFALLDTAFDRGGRSYRSQSTLTPLYFHGALEQLSGVSPVLIPLDFKNASAVDLQIRTLCRHGSGRPMLSFIQTHYSAAQLRDYWQYFYQPKVDGQSFLLRLGDTRVLAALPECLSVDNWAQLTAPVSSWAIVNRAGLLEWLPLPEHRAQCAVEDSAFELAITPVELGHLLQRGEPDAVVQAMDEHFNDLLPQSERITFYERISQSCAIASKHRIEAFPDVLSIALAVTITGGALLDDPRLDVLLPSKKWAAGELTRALTELVEALTP